MRDECRRPLAVSDIGRLRRKYPRRNEMFVDKIGVFDDEFRRACRRLTCTMVIDDSMRALTARINPENASRWGDLNPRSHESKSPLNFDAQIAHDSDARVQGHGRAPRLSAVDCP